MRLQELEEVNAEQDNTISAMNDKIKKLNMEIETWKFRYDALIEKFNREKATYFIRIAPSIKLKIFLLLIEWNMNNINQSIV